MAVRIARLKGTNFLYIFSFVIFFSYFINNYNNNQTGFVSMCVATAWLLLCGSSALISFFFFTSFIIFMSARCGFYSNVSFFLVFFCYLSYNALAWCLSKSHSLVFLLKKQKIQQELKS